MREIADAGRLRSLMRALGAAARGEATVYLVGGATAVLHGWRASTVDADLKLVPERDELMRAIPAIKESLRLNVEFASPGDFLPELPGWRERSPFVAKEGPLTFRHYDFYAQALAKLERRHERDVADARAMRRAGLVDGARLLEFLRGMEPQLYRFPAVDSKAFRAAVEAFAAEAG